MNLTTEFIDAYYIVTTEVNDALQRANLYPKTLMPIVAEQGHGFQPFAELCYEWAKELSTLNIEDDVWEEVAREFVDFKLKGGGDFQIPQPLDFIKPEYDQCDYLLTEYDESGCIESHEVIVNNTDNVLPLLESIIGSDHATDIISAKQPYQFIANGKTWLLERIEIHTS